MPEVTVQFDDQTLDALDDVAVADHDGDREAAAAALLERWLAERA